MAYKRLPCFYISHGGPNLVFDTKSKSYKFFQKWGNQILHEIKPKAIVVFSAHWETSGGINVGSFPGETPLIYDFYGFEDKYYKLTYHGKGSPELANRVVNLLVQSKFQANIDTKRGYDHGLWIPLKIAIPEPEIPIIQVSLAHNVSYEYHIKIGQALAPLRDEGVLLVCSGTMVHNLRELFSSSRMGSYVKSFDKDVEEYVIKSRAHPTDDHLVPLHIAAGASENDQGKKIYEEYVPGMCMTAFEFCGEKEE
ncbi:11377_t:CDS:2 [Diversispora eburnea]|uniref:11377_t:CDS:1 n=1 Tax=Diversispora eburnea TaxID=1213867 RepID=A0A9N8V0P7_9GLOM|nr:11377_t:CDS:2 [Diversispora eburnea]